MHVARGDADRRRLADPPLAGGDAVVASGGSPQRNRRPVGVSAASGPYFRPSSASAASRSQSGPDSPSAHGSSTGAGRSIVFSGSSGAEPGATVRSASERSGARPLRRL